MLVAYTGARAFAASQSNQKRLFVVVLVSFAIIEKGPRWSLHGGYGVFKIANLSGGTSTERNWPGKNYEMCRENV